MKAKQRERMNSIKGLTKDGDVATDGPAFTMNAQEQKKYIVEPMMLLLILILLCFAFVTAKSSSKV